MMAETPPPSYEDLPDLDLVRVTRNRRHESRVIIISHQVSCILLFLLLNIILMGATIFMIVLLLNDVRDRSKKTT